MCPVITSKFNCELCSSCDNCNSKEKTYICTCLEMKKEEVSESPVLEETAAAAAAAENSFKFTGVKRAVPEGFSFRACIECHLNEIKTRHQEQTLCDKCLNHQAYYCTCTESQMKDSEDLSKCRLCIQIEYFRKWPRSWRYFHDRQLPKFSYLLCDECVCRRYMLRNKGTPFEPCEECKEGLRGNCEDEDCRCCPHCKQFGDYLRFIFGVEYGAPF